MKMLTVLALSLLAFGADAFGALTEATLSFDENRANPILVRGESLSAFSARIRSELTCENLGTKLYDYQQTRTQLDDNASRSFYAVSNSLDQWDAELYRIVGVPNMRYTGALGRYARDIDTYNYNLRENQLKLQTYVILYNERLGECLRRAERF